MFSLLNLVSIFSNFVFYFRIKLIAIIGARKNLLFDWSKFPIKSCLKTRVLGFSTQFIKFFCKKWDFSFFDILEVFPNFFISQNTCVDYRKEAIIFVIRIHE